MQKFCFHKWFESEGTEIGAIAEAQTEPTIWYKSRKLSQQCHPWPQTGFSPVRGLINVEGEERKDRRARWKLNTIVEKESAPEPGKKESERAKRNAIEPLLRFYLEAD